MRQFLDVLASGFRFTVNVFQTKFFECELKIFGRSLALSRLEIQAELKQKYLKATNSS